MGWISTLISSLVGPVAQGLAQRYILLPAMEESARKQAVQYPIEKMQKTYELISQRAPELGESTMGVAVNPQQLVKFGALAGQTAPSLLERGLEGYLTPYKTELLGEQVAQARQMTPWVGPKLKTEIGKTAAETEERYAQAERERSMVPYYGAMGRYYDYQASADAQDKLRMSLGNIGQLINALTSGMVPEPYRSEMHKRIPTVLDELIRLLKSMGPGSQAAPQSTGPKRLDYNFFRR